MSKQSKSTNLGDIKRHLRSQTSELPPEGETVSPQPGPENEMSQDIETENERQRNSPASKCELDQLKDKVEDMENRNRQNNLRVIGVSEGKEGGNMMTEIERAHRDFGPRPNPEDRPMPILVRFLRSGDHDTVLRAAWEKGEIQYEGNRILIFPDFARVTQLKREKFREGRRALHAQGVKFAMMYPATLRIETSEGYKRFVCPKEAFKYVTEMGQ
ncbi:LINE-1 type transposase domain-containing protein 1 [Labeo rohita]|uniref:LINE-1 type transposase domain-containing protein 1 n=1 Tax=Labeo rohita TaxID=84645 RepID=A0ABQ8MH15_LABRO|nr:LINE-1 type transposase domain-containing protein 1 [Labeo rohita]